MGAFSSIFPRNSRSVISFLVGMRASVSVGTISSPCAGIVAEDDDPGRPSAATSRGARGLVPSWVFGSDNGNGSAFIVTSLISASSSITWVGRGEFDLEALTLGDSDMLTIGKGCRRTRRFDMWCMRF